MPFKSQAQRRKFAQLLVEGKISNQTFEEWNRETGDQEAAGACRREDASPEERPTGRRNAKKTVSESPLSSPNRCGAEPLCVGTQDALLPILWTRPTQAPHRRPTTRAACAMARQAAMTDATRSDRTRGPVTIPVSGTALLLIDVINDLAFEGSESPWSHRLSRCRAGSRP